MTPEQIQTLARETALKLKAWQHVDERQSVIATALTTVAADSEATIDSLRKSLDVVSQRDGSWIDQWGSCRICGGEIPHGHDNNCDHYKLGQKLADSERQLAEMTRSRDDWKARQECLDRQGYDVARARDAALADAKTWERNWDNVVSESADYCEKWNAAMADAAKLRAALESIQKLRPVGEGSRRLIDDTCDIADAALSPQPKGGDTPCASSLSPSMNQISPAISDASNCAEDRSNRPSAHIESGFDDAAYCILQPGDVLKEGDEEVLGKGGWGKISGKFWGDEVHLTNCFRRPRSPAAPAQPETPTPRTDAMVERLGPVHAIFFPNMEVAELELELSTAREATAKALAERDEAREHLALMRVGIEHARSARDRYSAMVEERDFAASQAIQDLSAERTARQAAEKEIADSLMHFTVTRRAILKTANCGVSGHFKFQENGGKCYTIKEVRDAMGIDWMNRDELSQAIPPQYSEYLARKALPYISARVKT